MPGTAATPPPSPPPPPILRPVRQAPPGAAEPGVPAPGVPAPGVFPHEGFYSPPMIPGLDAPLTRHYIEQYSSPGGKAWLNTVMQRGVPYLAFIRKEIEVRNLPMELLYLPVIESGFQPAARSRSGATGLWQFMLNSVSPYDMRINDWMDERIDFWKSTMSALSKLMENYDALGDWPLALAAYNAGLGGVSRLVKRTGIEDYWTLADRRLLTTETIHYVPRLLAVAYILSHPRRFGMTPLWSPDPEWTLLPTGGRMVDLDLLAAQAGVNPADLKTANRELLYQVTPPDEQYYLKVRSKDAPAIAAVLNQQDLVLMRYYIHTIASGDTLSELAEHYGVSVDYIRQTNPGVNPRSLRIGVRLLIPAFKDVEPYHRGRRQERPDAGAFNGAYTVQRGDTLWSIALAFNVDPEALAQANNMELNDVLREGRRLKTPPIK